MRINFSLLTWTSQKLRSQNQEQVPLCLGAETSVKPPSFLQWAASESVLCQARPFGCTLHFSGPISIFWIICIPGPCSFLFAAYCQIWIFLVCFKNISPSHRQAPVLVWDDSLELMLCKVPAKEVNPDAPLFSWAERKKLMWVTSAFRDPKGWMHLYFSWMKWQPSSLLASKLRLFYGAMVGIFPLFPCPLTVCKDANTM